MHLYSNVALQVTVWLQMKAANAKKPIFFILLILIQLLSIFLISHDYPVTVLISRFKEIV